jgi:hypothetical protein
MFKHLKESDVQAIIEAAECNNGSCFIVKDDDGKKTDRVPVKTDGLGDRFLGNLVGSTIKRQSCFRRLSR